MRRWRSAVAVAIASLAMLLAGEVQGATVEPAPGETLPPLGPRIAQDRTYPRLERVAPGLAAQLNAIELIAPSRQPSRGAHAPQGAKGADVSTLETRPPGLDEAPAPPRRMVAELVASMDDAPAADPARQPPEVIDLNTATPLELMRLPGIGPSRAQDIVRYRRARPFKRPSELLRIRGVGRRTYAKLKPFVRVGPPPPPAAQQQR